MPIKRSISIKFSRPILSFVLLIILVMLYSIYNISKELILENAGRDVRNLTESSVNQIDNVFNSIEQIPEGFALRFENGHVDKEDVRSSLVALISRIKLLYGSAVAFEPVINGDDTVYHAPYLYRSGDSVIFKNLASDDYRYYQQEWYTIPAKENRPVWSKPYFDKGGGERLMVTYSVPFYQNIDGERVTAGVVTADLSLKHLQAIITSIKFYESGFAMLLTESGQVITHPGINYDTLSRVVSITDWITDTVLLAAVRQMLDGQKNFIALEDFTNEEFGRDWISFAPIPSTGWSVAILFDEKDIYAGLNRLMMKLVILGAGGLMALALIIIQTSRRVTKPLKSLALATKEIGAGNLDFNIPEIDTKDEVAEMGKSIKHMQQDLIQYIEDLKRTTAEKEQIESEIKIASQIQMSMLPQEPPAPASINHYSINGFLHPAREVGGDFYDFILAGDTLYFSIGDVSGKGIPAALFMAKAITLFRAKAEKKLDVDRIAYEMNNDLGKYNENAMFVTFFIGALDYRKGYIEYCNAGHNPPLVHEDRSGPEALEKAHGLPLGLLPGKKYGKGKILLQDSARLLSFTDGITEAENSLKELYGEDRLREVLMRHAGMTSSQLIEVVLEDVRSFVGEADQSDDITLLLLNRIRSSSS